VSARYYSTIYDYIFYSVSNLLLFQTNSAVALVAVVVIWPFCLSVRIGFLPASVHGLSRG
jgi:hypothetical protein